MEETKEAIQKFPQELFMCLLTKNKQHLILHALDNFFLRIDDNKTHNFVRDEVREFFRKNVCGNPTGKCIERKGRAYSIYKLALVAWAGIYYGSHNPYYFFNKGYMFDLCKDNMVNKEKEEEKEKEEFFYQLKCLCFVSDVYFERKSERKSETIYYKSVNNEPKSIKFF